METGDASTARRTDLGPFRRPWVWTFGWIVFVVPILHFGGSLWLGGWHGSVWAFGALLATGIALVGWGESLRSNEDDDDVADVAEVFE